jgi:hypothetical protein
LSKKLDLSELQLSANCGHADAQFRYGHCLCYGLQSKGISSLVRDSSSNLQRTAIRMGRHPMVIFCSRVYAVIRTFFGD